MAGKFPIIVSGSIAMDWMMRFGGSFSEVIQPDKLDSLAVSVLLDELAVAYGLASAQCRAGDLSGTKTRLC
jgi:hypothetical protein